MKASSWAPLKGWDQASPPGDATPAVGCGGQWCCHRSGRWSVFLPEVGHSGFLEEAEGPE